LTALLARTDRIQVLFHALDEGLISTNALTFNQIESLRSHRDAAIRERAQARWGKPGAAQLDPADFATALQLDGTAARGEKTYLDRCATCHRAGQQGHALGPDFATVKAAGREKILTGILDPNREVAPNFIQYDLQTRDGESLSGIIAGETATSLTLRQANGLETVILRSQIAGMTSQGKSAMPEGLAEGLSQQDLADLMAFVVSQGN
jgi:putative heme-binding domain-containing protein